ncbi:helix-turn-helix transcriptional regulator [Agromyces sp. ISL-38]|uniref:TetR/AcrR family transcriptional regulator n=1 Tax=Agromyces sp. ISL-38 TaxID=2819107 RepID=UPI001BEADFEA|nr:helix-turn-helix domain-containing protein [Agromyces sp. ISL-38]MBT2500688.1 helix-turn-helix transcriptional regulator [Agromyces sp. ISL-38]MBT2516715.1 helix-turn-helix transcriptional regulator [Streptomyces sp. ISL-90]
MSTRDRILDAAAEVMSERGIAASTTRAIARAAGCSEALLYKYFEDKQQIFLAVLMERMPIAGGPSGAGGPGGPGGPGGTGSAEGAGAGTSAPLADVLADLVQRMFEFFVASFPMAASIFGSPALLAEHRESVRARGYGPEGAITLATAQLAREQQGGRIRVDADLESATSVLVGFAFHQAFLALFDGRDSLPADAVPRAVAVALPYLEPAGDDA